MEEHPNETELEGYAKGVLSAGDLLTVDDHLAVCASCRRRAAAAAATLVPGRRLADAVSAIKRELASDVTAQPALLQFPARSTAARTGQWIAFAAAAASLVIVADIVWGTRTQPTPAATSTVAALPPAPAQPVAPAPVDALTVAERAAVDAAIASGHLRKAQVLGQLNSRAGVLMGSQAQTFPFGPTYPVGVVVDADRPTLEWSPADSASEYRASVFDERFNMVAMSGWQHETYWTVDTPLPRGGSYVWQITARVGDREVVAPAPPQPESRFRVTSVEQSAQLADLRKRAGDSHLALAVLLAEAGVLDEAERELTLARTANPESSAVRLLQASLSSLRR